MLTLSGETDKPLLNLSEEVAKDLTHERIGHVFSLKHGWGSASLELTHRPFP
jgi:hypothetical protein